MLLDNKIKAELDAITEAVKANCDPVAIYLFGSYAYGTPHKDSDLDIYVVVPDSVEDVIDLSAKINYARFTKTTMPVDLVIGKRDAFERRKRTYTLEHTVNSKGVKLYGI